MIDVTVAGIPAQAAVVGYNPGCDGCSTAEFLRGVVYPPEVEEVEFELYDRRGYPAPWLEEKLDDRRVYEDVVQQIIEALQEGL